MLVSPSASQRRTSAGRRWLRSYVNGCAFKVWRTALNPAMAGRPFVEGAEWLHRASGLVLLGGPGELLARVQVAHCVRHGRLVMVALPPAALLERDWLSTGCPWGTACSAAVCQFACPVSAAGVFQGKRVILNPGRRMLSGTETAVVIGPSQEAVHQAMQAPFTPPRYPQEGTPTGTVSLVRLRHVVRCSYSMCAHSQAATCKGRSGAAS